MQNPATNTYTSDQEKRTGNSVTDTLAKERTTQSNAIQIPRISLPKGGGALRGIDEQFQVNPANGTTFFSIPLPLSANRNGFTPSIPISYNSGIGNSILGIGWQIEIPSISRSTDKKMPAYLDFTDEEDAFTFSGIENLVPGLEWICDDWQKAEKTIGAYLIQEYLPRIEGVFSRIERISHHKKESYWRITTRDNVTTIYGRSPECRIADPDNELKIFEWLPEVSFDDKGSVVKFEYKAENLINVPRASHEVNRHNGKARFTNRYLKRIQYGNSRPFYPKLFTYDADMADMDWHFQLIMDYGEHDALNPSPQEIHDWNVRPDPFSSYRSGFEIRTYRLLKRALLFHSFPDLNGFNPTLVRSLDFTYAISDSLNSVRGTELEFLQSITERGYIWNQVKQNYAHKSLPAIEFDYEILKWDHRIREVKQDNLIHAPVGISGNYQWVDLYSEGIPGILTEQGAGWFYKRNCGDINGAGDVRFENARLIIPKPSFVGLGNGVLQVQDLEANGQKQVVINNNGIKGYFELSEDETWEPFRNFIKSANIDLGDPNVRTFDINGDGKAEIVLSDQGAFWWWASKGKEGYDSPQLARQPFDEEYGPAVVFSDREQRIFLADMSGDGLIDIVRTRNGEVCYWPNLGYGRFGPKVTMTNAPWFDEPDLFNPQYLHLEDISGTGATDLIYLGKNKFKAYVNLSGNCWGNAECIEPFFPAQQPNNIKVTDLLGNGTSCIVWSSELPAYAGRPMRYIDLMGGKKPHIMTGYRNNMGKEVAIYYKSSTWFYLKDKTAGTPWISKLPFPVQCVQKKVITEKITGLRFTTEYSYHHGYYDHSEREFRGFGRVEQLDSETFGEFTLSESANARHETLHQPTVLTKRWFHTGLFMGRHERVLTQFEKEYWYNNLRLAELDIKHIESSLPEAQLLEAHSIPSKADVLANFSPEEWREAFRACKGMLLRQEIFAVENTGKKMSKDQLKLEAAPYSVSTHNCEIQILQPKARNPHAVFVVRESEAISYQYERQIKDPRIAHTLNIEVDRYGNIVESASVVYGRLSTQNGHFLQPTEINAEKLADCLNKAEQAQKKIHILYTRNDYTKDNQKLINSYRLPILYQTSTYELNGFDKELLPISERQINLYKISDFKGVLNKQDVSQRHYQEILPPLNQKSKRLIEQLRTLFLNDLDLTSPLTLGEQGKRGLLFENYQLAYTPALLAHIYHAGEENNTATIQIAETDLHTGSFVSLEDNWWIRSGISHLIDEHENPQIAHERFFLPVAYSDSFNSVTRVVYDNHLFFVKQVIDPVGNTTIVEDFNYRTLSAITMLDANDDRSMVLQDELGLVKAMAVLGKGDEADTLDGLTEWESLDEESNVAVFFVEVSSVETDSALLQQHARNLLKQATTRFVYDFHRYHLSGYDQHYPVVAGGMSREEHHAVLIKRGQSATHRIQISCDYSDGFGKVAMTKAQAEPGSAKKLIGGDAAIIVDTNGKMRWIGNGRTVYNNKGNPILQYEPYFSTSAGYESAPVLIENGVFIQLTYDPLGRVIRTDFPDGTYSRFEFDAWSQTTYDQNDTAEGTSWYTNRINQAGSDHISKKLQKAVQQVTLHTNTPSRLFLDSLGRPVLGVEHLRDQYGLDEKLYVRAELDIEGNARAIFDARFNRVITYDYDMLGHRVFQDSMDAGKRWIFSNAIGNPVKIWDQRQYLFMYVYDALHRPLESHIIGGEGEQTVYCVYEKIIYGEDLPNDKARRLRGNIAVHYDKTGCILADEYDFKGNLLRNTRRLAKAYQQIPDWRSEERDALLQEESFITTSVFDALNRAVQQTTPHSDRSPARKFNIAQNTFNDAGLLEQVHLWLQHDTAPCDLLDPATAILHPVANINYNEKAQRTLIQYGNGIVTRYRYDPETFKLLHLRTAKKKGDLLQDLSYTYDPVGNIMQLWDKAIPAVFYKNHRIDPLSTYQYDSLYRLTRATGREHTGQQETGQYDNWKDDWSQLQMKPDDIIAFREYTQTYHYDAAGNILQLHHHAGPQGSWVRRYTYEHNTNRLLQTTVSGLTYAYPHHKQHGFITEMPHLQKMKWNFREELMQTVQTAGGQAAETWYTYDSGGQRSRKVNATAKGNICDERLYIGSFELYRKGFSQQGYAEENALERETLHLMDGEKRILMVDIRTIGKDGYDTVTQRYQIGNHLESVTLEVDENSNIINYEEYHPYGTTAYQSTHATIKATAKRYCYTGMERDDETGLAYHSARYYIPWLGRWLSPDPIGIKDGLNMYSYGKGRVLNGTDRNGTFFWLIPIVIGGYVLLSPEPANAPGPADKTYPRRTSAEFAWDTTKFTATVTAGGLAGNAAKAAFLTRGVSPFLASTGGGMIGGVSSQTTSSTLEGKLPTGDELLMSSAMGLAGGVLDYGFTRSMYGSVSMSSSIDDVPVGMSSSMDDLTGGMSSSIDDAAVGISSSSEETISLYHGSINNAPSIQAKGLDPSRTPTWVTRDPNAAWDAIRNPNRTQFFDDLSKSNVIESRIPRSEFDRVMSSSERPYHGFNKSVPNSSEVVLRTEQQVNMFNEFICRPQ